MPNSPLKSESIAILPLADFGLLQQRYNALGLSLRAAAVLSDAEPALQMADQMLAKLAGNATIKHITDGLRKNQVLLGKMRPSEAKNMLMDSSADFVEITRQKLAAWRKTMERLASGEGVIEDAGSKKEYIPAHLPVAVAVSNLAAVGAYLSIIQLILMEMGKTDNKMATECSSDTTKIRRCATFISDCELAASIAKLVN